MNQTQELQLELIRKAGSWNGFDGDDVADALIQCQDMWDAFMMKKEALVGQEQMKDRVYAHGMDWRELAFLGSDQWDSDTLFILANPGSEHRLYAFVEASFGADEVDWVDDIDLDHNVRGRKILRVWWD